MEGNEGGDEHERYVRWRYFEKRWRKVQVGADALATPAAAIAYGDNDVDDFEERRMWRWWWWRRRRRRRRRRGRGENPEKPGCPRTPLNGKPIPEEPEITGFPYDFQTEVPQVHSVPPPTAATHSAPRQSARLLGRKEFWWSNESRSS